jgi:diguanylate cyclase (GGDEF)-like protein
MSRPTRLTVLLSVIAAVVVVAGLLIGFRVISEPHLDFLAIQDDFFRGPHRFAILAGVAAISLGQLAPLRLRVGASAVQMAWGEAAIIVACVWLPAALVPVSVLVGVTIAHVARSIFAVRRPANAVVFNIVQLTVAGCLATAAVTAINPSYEVRLDAHTIVALCAGAVAWFATSGYLVACRLVAGGQSEKVGSTFRAMVGSRLIMLVGNMALGLLIVWAQYTNVWFLLFLPPLLWLLHQFYGHRLRGDDERRTWQEFAEATRGLNRLDERDAANAGIAGALSLFRATRVEITIEVPGGPFRSYSSDAEGANPVVNALDGMISRPLLVRHVRVGELRLFGVGAMRPREVMMLAAYGDALAAAVHDAITHDELRTMSERTTYDAVHDPLTGLVNRAALLTRGNNALRNLDAATEVALLLLDINDFKEVNNALGHTAGDELLQVIARRLTDSIGRGNVLARLGGDEFALLLVNISTSSPGTPSALTAAVDRARALGEELAVPVEVAGVVLSVEASAGVVVAPAGVVDMTELLRRADIAMYQAKRGGQPVAWYDAVRDEASTDRLALLAELREALSTGDQLTLALQPAVALNGGSGTLGDITGVEALIRWQHPRRGRLMPDQFLPTVEQSELIGPLTLRVLDLALGTAARWRAIGIEVPVSVNLSARSLLDRKLPLQVDVLLTKHQVPADQLVLEITESVVLSDLKVTDNVLAELRAIGVQLAVDDFGTGYSSLTFLTRVQVEEVKIDRIFVQKMFDSPEASAIVRTTIALARELGLRVVAEGVETAEQRAVLARYGCTAAQGYHFFAPLSADKTLAVLRERRQPGGRGWRAG